MRRLGPRLALLLVSTTLCLVAAEIVLRAVAPPHNHGEMFYADGDHCEVVLQEPMTPELRARVEAVMQVVPDGPRFRMQMRPNTTLYVCYRGQTGRPDFDDHGCVAMTSNSWGVRDREEVCGPKPPGQTRVVCIGDSTTMGWGVQAEATWVRGTEVSLRRHDDQIRLINCGGAGAIFPDEYAHALATRFARFAPDVVLVTLCLNDLLPVNGGMSHIDLAKLAARNAPLPGLLSHSALASGAAQLFRADPLTIDPTRDLVAELLTLPVEAYSEDVRPLGKIFWDSGVPQASLLRMRDWCRERQIRFGVAVWPFLQQLETRATHPFRGIHDRVKSFCEAEAIACLDLLDTFIGRDPRTLWVTSKDMHGNGAAQALAVPRYAEFLTTLLTR